MAPQITNQRVEAIEEEITGVRETVTILQETLHQQFTEKMSEISQRLAEMAAANDVLHNSLNEVREEVRATLTSDDSPLKSGGGSGGAIPNGGGIN